MLTLATGFFDLCVQRADFFVLTPQTSQNTCKKATKITNSLSRIDPKANAPRTDHYRSRQLNLWKNMATLLRLHAKLNYKHSLSRSRKSGTGQTIQTAQKFALKGKTRKKFHSTC